MREIDDIHVNKLVGQYGSPLFIVSTETIKRNLRTFINVFSKKYPNTEVAYAYKANYLLGVLDIVHKEGAWAEVASGFEYELARTLGVPGKSIVFNGPYKRKDELRKASEEGALINVDNTYELKLLGEIALELGNPIEIGIRINADVGIPQASDRFGFNLKSGEALGIVSACLKDKLLKIVGLHIHLTSYIIESDEAENQVLAKRIKLIWPKDAGLYRAACEKVARFAEEIRNKFGVTINYIDMGGGFPNVDFLGPYTEAIVEPILNEFERKLPILILEPGRAIVKNSIDLIATVVGIKEFPDGKRGIIIDAGTNLLPDSYWTFQEIEPLRRSEGILKETIVYGPLCLQTDIIGRAELPELKVGDRVVIKSVGAYNISQSSPFIFPRPCVLLIEDGGVRVLRRSETISDIFLLENM